MLKKSKSKSSAPIEASADPKEITLTDSERQPCEVWTRVMGYHRPVASFNIGKKGEHYERNFFKECSPTGSGSGQSGFPKT